MDWRRIEATRERAPRAALAEVRPSIRDFTQYLGAGRGALGVIPLLVRGSGSPGHGDTPDGARDRDVPAGGGDAVALARGLDDLEIPALAVATAPGSGRLDDLVAIAAAVSAPVLRWDCVADEDRLYESRRAGADAVLVPVAVAGDALAALVEKARAIHVAVVAEVATGAEVDAALAARAPVIVLASGSLDLASRVPPRFPVVAADDVSGGADLERMRGHVDAVLVATPIDAAPARVAGLVTAAAEQ
jgi:indole-3-glycerol phosphate synthase